MTGKLFLSPPTSNYQALDVYHEHIVRGSSLLLAKNIVIAYHIEGLAQSQLAIR